MAGVSHPVVPQHCPTPAELDDLELLVGGGFAPVRHYGEPGGPTLPALPHDVAAQADAAGAVELVDPEGLPLARVSLPDGAVEPLAHPQFGPFRRLYLTPAQTAAAYRGRTFVPVRDALSARQLAALADLGPVVLLALVGTDTPTLSVPALLRASLAAADLLPDAAVVAVPLTAASHADPERRARVLAAYAGADPVHDLEPEDAATRTLPPTIAEIVSGDSPAPGEIGLVVFFTGFSGSGKSTLARALTDRLLEQGQRRVTSLDGDVVRRMLSAGLGFSREDRETNIRRIGWVAAEVSRHGGVAICSPIAPFDQTRQQVREMVRAAGGAFVLVHVATSLAECERRDRKGLYARARRGEIPDFTGISSPYEEPTDAEVRVDTEGRSIEAALADVWHALVAAGHLAEPARHTD